MDPTKTFLLVAITSLGVIVLILTVLGRTGRRPRRLTPLAGVAFACVLASMLFSDDRPVGYALVGAGVLLALLDLLLRSRRRP